ncbi:hypothetical protein P4607_12185 [Priestia megaterium]|jgi:hypothetical protein|uniref:hypothetical protein n=1 Tax=Priestia megaterium TaxID=1404 RepID=UPI000BEBF243|nr:hypothetical protein [Priestia megaterium]MED3852115.1 hypothetical protein [Priestia megaterium]PEB61377.1 hypothetical protein COM86_24645 [Priestia megaterium]PEE77274.1 hypothetical protein COM81_08305 [Priestia megaterium]
MVEKLLNLLDDLEAKDHQILDAIHALNVESDGFLTEESEQVERLIVYVLGGNDKHFEYIQDSGVFMDYANKETSRSELISTIRQAIENDWKGPIQTSATFS